MGSPSSKRSRSAKTASVSIRDRFQAAFHWCSENRYASLGITTALCALLVLGAMNSQSTTATLDHNDDELAALEEFDDLSADLGDTTTAPVARRHTAVARSGQPSQFDDLTPMFGNMSSGSGVMTATFEGAPRSMEAGPVWLAGTIETDDVPMPAEFLPAIPAPVQHATGPLLTPQ